MSTPDSAGSNVAIKTHPLTVDYDLTHHKLGEGVNGKVMQVRRKNTDEHYALKILPNSPKGRREVDIHLRCAKSPYVVQVVDVYENEWEGAPHILLVLEQMSGGELFERIRAKAETDSGFTEQEACGVVRQLALGIRDLHRINVAHRDLKPENFLFTDGNEIRIIDFGFAKHCGDALTTPIYTPYYVAPEVLNVKTHQANSYDKGCDLWSLGVVVYIMLAGYPPFYSYSQQQSCLSPGMEQRIRTGEYDFDDEVWDTVSDRAKGLVKQLLVTDPEQRLTIDEVVAHPWLLTSGQSLLPKTPLKLPVSLAESPQLWDEANEELASALTCMRVSDGFDAIKPLSKSASGLLAKRLAASASAADADNQIAGPAS